jgi:hypothetical protein
MQTDLLVLARGDLLQEICNALALRASETQGLKEVQHILSRTMVHQVTCMPHAHLSLRPLLRLAKNI